MELRTRLSSSTIDEHRPKADQPDVYPRGRRCAHEPCITLLSIYDPGPKCYQHTPRRSKLIRTIEELQEAMAS